MANMSYVRFRNTDDDLRDCESALADLRNLDELSAEERRAAVSLIERCIRIANDNQQLLPKKGR